MPRSVNDVLDEVNMLAGRRYLSLDPLLPYTGDPPDGCSSPLIAVDQAGRPAGFGLCCHNSVPADSLDQTWGMATRYVLTLRLRDPDTLPATDLLLAQWHEHLSGLREANDADTAAMVTWPSRETSGVRALLKHGMQPIEVLAARPSGRTTPAPDVAGVVVRDATPGDIDAVVEMTMSLIAHDAQFGAIVPRPATEALVRSDARVALKRQPSWIWLAERRRHPVGLVVVQPPRDATWITGMTGAGPAAYLVVGFVTPEERGTGTAAMLVRQAHAFLDAERIAVTLLHYSQVNPASGPFWARMGYRPLWTSWQVRPAAALR